MDKITLNGAIELTAEIDGKPLKVTAYIEDVSVPPGADAKATGALVSAEAKKAAVKAFATISAQGWEK